MINVDKLKDSDKVVCIDDSKQKVLKEGVVYTVDLTIPPYGDRFYIKEWKRFAFKADRFVLVEEVF